MHMGECYYVSYITMYFTDLLHPLLCIPYRAHMLISPGYIPAEPPAPPCPLLPLFLSLSFLSVSPLSSPLTRLLPRLLRLLARDGVDLVGPDSSAISTSSSCLFEPMGMLGADEATNGTPAVGN